MYNEIKMSSFPVYNTPPISCQAFCLRLKVLRGPPLEYGGGGPRVLLEINIFGGKMGEQNKWPQGLVEIKILSTQEVEINIL